MSPKRSFSPRSLRRWSVPLGLAGVLAFWLWAAWPLLLWTDRAAFAGKLSTDNVVSAWFYDFVARSAWNGWDLGTLFQLNHPRPHETRVEFPAIMDAVIAAPLGWMLGWPRQWGAAQALALLVNGLSGALLARALGARGLGLLFAGCLAILCRPVWKDLVMARMNAVWPGFAALSLAALIGAIKCTSLPRGTLLALAAAVLGALSATIYPPGLLLFAPFGIVLVGGPVGEARWAGRALGLLALVAGALLAAPELMRILETRTGHAGLGNALSCPDRWASLRAVDLARLRPDGRQGLSEPAVVLTAWLAAPLVLLHRRRLAGILAIALIGLYAASSLGPCPEWTLGQTLSPLDWPLIGPSLVEIWRLSGPLHDFSRYAGIAVLVAAVLGGLGLQALAGRSLPRTLLAITLGALIIGHIQWVVLSERLSPHKWHDASPPETAAFLNALSEDEKGPVAELPFDRREQFLSLVGAPLPPRINPLRPGENPPLRQPFIEWLYMLGLGQLERLPASPPAPDPSLVRWVFFDPDRCKGGGVKASACDPQVPALLEMVLGPPRVLPEGTLAWEVVP